MPNSAKSFLIFIIGFQGDLFRLMLNVPVNSYGHVRMVGSPNQTFFLGKFD